MPRSIPGPFDTNARIAKVKELILMHRDSFEKHSDLDFKAIGTMSYLYEFDREVQ